MPGELGQALTQFNEDDAVRAVVITGAGKAFCAGADLGGGGKTFGRYVDARRQDDARKKEQQEAVAKPPRRILSYMIDKPVIAAINGHAVGVGITYPMLCDIRYVAEWTLSVATDKPVELLKRS